MRCKSLCVSMVSATLAFSLFPAQGLAEALGEAESQAGGQSPESARVVEKAAGEPLADRPEADEQGMTLSYRLNAEKDDDPWTTVASTKQAPEVASDAQPVSRIDLRLKEGVDGTVKLRARAADAQWPAEWTDEGAAAAVSMKGSFEELQVALTGKLAQTYDVWYRVHVGERGWFGWARNGESAGTKGLGMAVDDLQVLVLDKGVLPEDFDEQAKAFAEREADADKTDETPASGDASSKADPGQGSDADAGQKANSDKGADAGQGAGSGKDAGTNPGVANSAPASPATEPPADAAPNDKPSVVQNQAVTPSNATSATDAATTEKPQNESPAAKSTSPSADASTHKTGNESDKSRTGSAQPAPDPEQKDVPVEKPAPAQKPVPEKQPTSTAADLTADAGLAADADLVADTGLVAQAQKRTPTVRYDAHVQNVGWQSPVTNGATAGTSGRGFRVEAMHISLESGVDGGITYRTHVQNVGWQNWVRDGQLTGTTGKSLRLEAVEIKLTGNVAKDYDVWYRGHVQNIGWQKWVRNGATAGTSGRGFRVEALQVILMPKGAGSPTSAGAETVAGKDKSVHASVSYRGHVSGMGWQGWMANGDVAGTTGLSAPLTGFSAQLVGLNNSELHYSAHVQNVGWDKEVTGGHQVGYPSKGNRVEAIKMRLSGTAEKNYDIYYRMHVSNIGWMGWAKNGAAAGTQGLSGRVEAIQVVLVAKSGVAPANDGDRAQAFIESPNFQMRGHVQNIGWQGWVGNGGTCGTSGRGLRVEGLQAKVSSTVPGGVQMRGHVQNIGWQDWADSCGTSGQGLRVEALQMRLTGDLANVFDIYYRVHAQNFGWMGWAKNGEYAGTSALSMRLEAVQVQVVAKGLPAPGSSSGAYLDGAGISKMGYQNPPGFYQVSSKNVTITPAATSPFNYITPSRIGVWASRQDCVDAFLQRAREYVGTPYVWNYACAPGVGVDCIGLVYQCAYACGMDLGGGTGDTDFNPWAHYVTGNSGWHSHDAENFWNYGRAAHVPLSSIQPGDLISWSGHIAIYMGGDTLIEAYTPETGVIYSSLSSRSNPRGAIRLFQ